MGLFDLFFPKRCVGCKKEGSYWCPRCVANSKLQFPQVCPVCERASIDGITHPSCLTKLSPEGLFSVWVYQGSLKTLIHKIKYKFTFDMAQTLSLEAVKIIKKHPILSQKDIILVPIPLYWKRENWRGFNQAEELGKIIAFQLGWKVTPLLQRRVQVKTQVGLSEEERKKNIFGVFCLVSSSPVSNFSLPIVLFDDVWTTGATMLEATKVLKKAGFKNVWCLTLAR